LRKRRSEKKTFRKSRKVKPGAGEGRRFKSLLGWGFVVGGKWTDPVPGCGKRTNED